MLTIYLCSDLDKITQEIADNSDEMKQTLEENSGCEKYQLFLTFNIRANKSVFFFRSAARFCAGLLLVLSLGLLGASGLLIHGIKLVSK